MSALFVVSQNASLVALRRFHCVGKGGAVAASADACESLDSLCGYAVRSPGAASAVVPAFVRLRPFVARSASRRRAGMRADCHRQPVEAFEGHDPHE